jgi:hypothetical protein
MNLTAGLLSSTTPETRWANDTDGFVLAAHPGQSQGRPRKSTGSQPIAQTAYPTCVLPKSPSSRNTNLRPGPDTPVSDPQGESSWQEKRQSSGAASQKPARRGWAVPGSNGRPPACKARASIAVYRRRSLRPSTSGESHGAAVLCCGLPLPQSFHTSTSTFTRTSSGRAWRKGGRLGLEVGLSPDRGSATRAPGSRRVSGSSSSPSSSCRWRSTERLTRGQRRE